MNSGKTFCVTLPTDPERKLSNCRMARTLPVVVVPARTVGTPDMNAVLLAMPVDLSEERVGLGTSGRHRIGVGTFAVVPDGHTVPSIFAAEFECVFSFGPAQCIAIRPERCCVPRRREVVEDGVLKRHRAGRAESRAGTESGKNGIAVHIKEEVFETCRSFEAPTHSQCDAIPLLPRSPCSASRSR